MTIKKKTILTSLILGASILLLIIFAVNPIFGQIKKESNNLIAQRNKLAERELKIRNIQDFKSNFKQYQTNLEKINELLINPSEPIEFIEFLEKEAADSQFFIEITPPILRETQAESWSVMEFRLSLNGTFPNFLRFLERLESGPYLVEVINLNIRKNLEINGITAILLINTYTK